MQAIVSINGASPPAEPMSMSIGKNDIYADSSGRSTETGTMLLYPIRTNIYTLELEYILDNADDLIPLGEWTITEPSRRERDFIEIVAEDCISQLDVPINDKYVGWIDIPARMNKVTELTGVRFSQTAEEIKTLMNTKLYAAGSSFCRNCREEVSAIAKFIGGIAYANRFGRIAFRKFGSEPVLRIRAERRHKAALAEYTFGIRGVAYTDSIGYTTTVKWGGTPVNTAAVRIYRISGTV